ncbi:hypothetical protein LRH25_05040 [Ideonella azotifigens]|uniref:Uncharacterized protein n=1 Tax=Ideonella azotifigens TaxID=513160 RepID=A0ABN1JLC7_9BURK|nr:hypothetical protein [Ideonella azotifigens]MCD2339705.1 hypothetical protein [Ideonella azotifigens]
MTLSPRTAFRQLLPLALSGLFAVQGSAALAAQAEASFDFGQSHPYLGFGAQVWLNDNKPEQSTQMLRDLHARYVRVGLAPKILLNQLRPGMSVQDALTLIKANDSEQQRQRLTRFGEQMKQLGIQIHLIFWRMPEPWARYDTQRKSGSKDRSTFADPARVADYANLVTAQMVYLRGLGITADAVELTNEPHGAWSTLYTREDYARLVQAARAAMQQNGLGEVKIAGPGVNLKQFDHYIGALQQAKATDDLGYISAHVYENPELLSDPRQPGMASFLGRGHFGPIVITEFGAQDGKAKVGARSFAVTEPAYGLSAIAQAGLLLNNGASALIYWQLKDFNWGTQGHGLLSEDGQRRPVAQALQTIVAPLPAGAKIAAVQGRMPAGLVATAFQTPQNSYLMISNSSDEPHQLNARLQGGSGHCGKIAQTQVWRTGGEGGGAVKAPEVSDCTVKAGIGPGSAVLVVLQ